MRGRPNRPQFTKMSKRKLFTAVTHVAEYVVLDAEYALHVAVPLQSMNDHDSFTR